MRREKIRPPSGLQQESDPPVTVRKLLFTVQEAAERLHVPPSWLYQRTSKKLIPFRKMGKYVRFSEEDLQAIIAAAGDPVDPP
jgi:excisionase family DNA binding protein